MPVPPAEDAALERKIDSLAHALIMGAALVKFIDATDPKSAMSDAREIAKLMLDALT